MESANDKIDYILSNLIRGLKVDLPEVNPSKLEELGALLKKGFEMILEQEVTKIKSEMCKRKAIKEMIESFEKELEKEATLITEAVGDVVDISRMNDYDSAFELVKRQFIVIDRQDLEDDN